MRCARCRGFMVDEFLVERASEGFAAPGVWRCVNCGELVDLRVLHNRMASLTQLLQLAHLKEHRFGRGAGLSTGEGVKETASAKAA